MSIAYLVISLLAACGLYHRTVAEILNTTDCDSEAIGHVGNVVIYSSYPIDITKPINGSADIFLNAGHPKINGAKIVLELLRKLKTKRFETFGTFCENGKGKFPIPDSLCVHDMCSILGQHHCDAVNDPNVTHYELRDSIKVPVHPAFKYLAKGTYDVTGSLYTADRETKLGCITISGLRL